MGDALPVGGLAEGIGEVGSPIAALRAEGLETALQRLGHVAPRIVLERIRGRRGELDRYIWIFGEGHHLVDRVLDRAGLGDFNCQIHVIDDERQLWVTLRDCRELRGVAGRQKHDGQTGFLGRRPEPVRAPALQ